MSKIEKVYKTLKRQLSKDTLLKDDLSLVALAADAGCYKKTPGLIIKPSSEDDIITAVKELKKQGVPVTFRAAGTSLSGQAISDTVLMQIAGDRWQKTEVLENGKYVRTQPGITGLRLNQVLKPYGVKFGPDPASVNSAMIGGIIANNASGMSCGIHANSYSTLKSARIIFADGSLLDTSSEESREKFLRQKPGLIREINKIRDQILADKELSGFIKRKYEIKNTTGYGLNSFIDYSDPIDILLHLMIGSEGTLGVITEAVFETVPVKPYRASSLLYFKDLSQACDAVPHLKKAGVPAIELMDRRALRSVEGKKGIPSFISEFNENVTALLIDLEAESEDELNRLIDRTENAIHNFELERDFELARDADKILEIWKVRKGVFPSVGGMRKPGTVVIIEDVAVRTERLREAVKDLRDMLDKNGYEEAVIYGHALDGNLHFIFSQNFEDPKELEQYENLINEVVKLIVDKYEGSLKAEHGTGLNMAPFVKYEWGETLYEYMKLIKQSFDPWNIFNPGIIINEDEKVHLKSLKKMPQVDESVDTCIECGFCEISCLSTGFTLSARQRIVVQRELKLLHPSENNRKRIRNINHSFRYAGDKTCAGDSLCSVTCPLDIDTGILIKKMRNERNKNNGFGQNAARKIAHNFDSTISLMRQGLGAVSFMHRMMGTSVFQQFADIARAISLKTIPRWNSYMPGPSGKIKKDSFSSNGHKKVVYFPSCINQAMGAPSGNSNGETVVESTLSVLEKAGYDVVFPENMDHLCCGTPWESKGFFDIADMKSKELEKALLEASQQGEHVVLCDTSPCIYRMKNKMNGKLRLYEPVEFIHDYLLQELKITRKTGKTAFHITCSSTKMDLEKKFRTVAGALTESPVFPEEVGCCGFAGDKGFTQPELNDYALRKLRQKVEDCNVGFSNSRTCEIGLSRSAGIDYNSIMSLLDACSESQKELHFTSDAHKPG